MPRHIILGLVAATLASTTLVPEQAQAHHRGRVHAGGVRFALYWSDPRASRAGYPGGHYGSDCYRAANGRWICRDRY